MKNLTIIFSVVIIFSCTKEDITPRKFPRINTLAVTNITNQSVTFHGELVSTNTAILDHGFLWLDQSSPTFGNGDRISLGPVSTPGHFQALCERGMTKGKKFYVRTFVVTEDNIVYGYPIEFISQGSKPPVLTDFYPAIASWGDTITLVGQNLSEVPANTLVKFNGAQATVTDASSTELKVKVPYEILDELTRISISHTGATAETSTISKNFQLKQPVIDNINPSSGAGNTEIVITGKFLSSTRVAVYFNDKPASITKLTLSTITCKVPEGLSVGMHDVKVTTGNGNLFTTSAFEVF